MLSMLMSAKTEYAVPLPVGDIFLMAEAHFFRDGICCLKPDPPDIIRKSIGVLLHDPDTVAAIGLEDLCRMGGTDIMSL